MADILTLSPAPARASQAETLPALLLRRCVETATLAGRAPTPGLLREILRSAPATIARLTNDTFLVQSACWQCLRQAEGRLNRGAITVMEFDKLVAFWLESFAGKDLGLHTSVLTLLNILADAEGGAVPSPPAPPANHKPYWK